MKAKQLDAALATALADRQPILRTKARRILAELRPADAIAPLKQALAEGETIERQEALAALATLHDPQADAVLVAVAR